MVSDSWAINLTETIEVIHDFPRANKLRGLNATLELITTIKVKNIPFVLVLDNLDKSCKNR